MKISLRILAECLQAKGYTIVRQSAFDDSDPEFALPLLIRSENEKLENGCLYAADASSLPRNPYLGLQVGLITIGEPPEAYSGRCSLLILEEGITFWNLYTDLVEIYRQYDSWLTALDELFAKKAPLQAYLDVTYPLVKNTISVHDPLFSTLAIVPQQTPYGKNFYDAISEISPEWIIQNQKADLTKHEPYLSSYTFYDQPRQTLMCNIFDEEALLALVNISDSYAPLRQIDSWILTKLAGKIRRALIADQKILHNQMKSFRRTFADLIDGVHVTPQELKRRTKRAGFSDSDTWLIVYLRFDPAYSSHTPLDAIIRQVQRQIPAMTSLQFNTDFALLIDLTLCGGKAENTLHQLTDILSGSKCIIGGSSEFTNLSDSRFYFKESRLASVYGPLLTPAEKYFTFEAVAPYHLLYYGTTILPGRLLCAKGVLDLIELDKTSGNSYCETLEVYLQNHMNITKSAKDLNIHRSTLLYRLDRIREYLDIDTTDLSKQLYILQSLTLCTDEQRHPELLLQLNTDMDNPDLFPAAFRRSGIRQT